MEPTVRPWASKWRRVHRIRIGSGPRNDYWHTPHLSLYTGHHLRLGDQHATNRHIIRFPDELGTRVLFPTPANPWLHQPFNTETWKLSNQPPDLENSDTLESYIPERPPPPPSPPPPPRPLPTPHHAPWTDSTLGWVAGTVLLAVFVLIVRATEKCLDRRLFKARRRQSEEWPTPNVLATSHQHTPSDIPLRTDTGLQMDLPPPYSECARPKPQCEDPPPPYSDCYVAFINPKDGVPSAHIMMRERDDVGSNLGNNAEETITINSNENQENVRPEDENIETICVINIETSIGIVGVNTTKNQNNDVDVGNIGTVCVNIGDDIEANTNSRIETVGVHIGANAGNGNVSRDVMP